MHTIKILHFIEDLRAGGKERQLVEILKGFSNYKKISCDSALMSNNIHYDEVNKLGINIHLLIRKIKKDPLIFIKLYNLCKEFKPDIIHSWGSMPSVYAVPVAKMLGIKLINGMIRGATPLKLFKKEYIHSKITFPFSDVVVANSYAGLKAYNVPVKKKIYIYSGFDFKRLKRLRDKGFVKQTYKITTEQVVGMVATFSDKKDYETYFRAAEKILKKRNNVTFLAVGDGETLENLRKSIRPQFSRKIRFLGKQNDVESIVNVFDVGVLATNNKIHEGISNSIMEYMALSKPVVATRGGGTNELIEEWVTGFMVPSGDYNKLSHWIEHLLTNKQLAEQMGKAGKKRLKDYFSMKNMIESYIALYNGLAS